MNIIIASKLKIEKQEKDAFLYRNFLYHDCNQMLLLEKGENEVLVEELTENNLTIEKYNIKWN